jgi:hypothetical protein
MLGLEQNNVQVELRGRAGGVRRPRDKKVNLVEGRAHERRLRALQLFAASTARSTWAAGALPSLPQRRVAGAAKDKRGLPAQFLQLIAQLYKVEADARDAELDTAALKAQRSERSVQVLDDLEKLLLARLHGVLPGSLLGKALDYMASQWAKLKRCIDDGAYATCARE